MSECSFSVSLIVKKIIYQHFKNKKIMANVTEKKLNDFMAKVIAKNPSEIEFHQAVHEVVSSLLPYIEEHPQYSEAKILERMVEPERTILFRVPWLDDKGEVQINKGFRIEMNSAIGPYKGGLRFHPTVNLGILKFLAFEQVLKNSLTTLPMGGGKGGTDFDPKGKSDNEVMRFCQSFMSELFRHIGPNTDVPAGDIGVGGREIGFLFGQYKRLRNEFTGVLTGKGIEWGGSLIRPEATGYGATYFAEEMLKTRGQSFKGKIVAISGSGNVAQYATEKVTQLGGKVVTLSDSSGYIYDPNGIDAVKLAWIMQLKNVKRGRIAEYVAKFGGSFVEGERPWGVKCDVAMPCATQNEINEDEAKLLIKNGCFVVSEGANMPSTPEAVDVYINSKILYGPGKAANAGGVATSGLEMSQNSLRLSWTREEVDARLHQIMVDIHNTCVKYGTQPDGFINYVNGANIGGFVKVADAMLAQGLV
jgi:glutamate dehydrogenase/leucine dehydrogenase